ncbi:MAG: hypothetical protein HYY16_13955 [Planctomycetes bacterium]|nr:hypothetical protein [Planctomycetota bacterium]
MHTTKLTLSADKDLIKEAKKLADREGTSLSSMFARFLRAVLREWREKEQPGPVTSKATGLVKLPAGKSDRQLLEEALREKCKVGR